MKPQNHFQLEKCWTRILGLLAQFSTFYLNWGILGFPKVQEFLRFSRKQRNQNPCLNSLFFYLDFPFYAHTFSVNVSHFLFDQSSSSNQVILSKFKNNNFLINVF